MNPTAMAWRAGWSRGLIELRQSLTNGGDLFNHFFWPVLMLIALFFLREVSFGQSGFSLGTLALPSILGMNAAMSMISMSQQLTADREDGTLLRAKATPNGMVGYLLGKIISVSGGLVVDLAIFLIPAVEPLRSEPPQVRRGEFRPEEFAERGAFVQQALDCELVLSARIGDDVVNSEKITRVIKRGDELELVVNLHFDFARYSFRMFFFRIAPLRAGPCQILEMLLGCLAFRHRLVGVFVVKFAE